MIAELDKTLWVNTKKGDDNGPGTYTTPLATYEEAIKRCDKSKKLCIIRERQVIDRRAENESK